MYTKEQRMTIGKEAYDKVDSVKNLADKYGVGIISIYNWKKLYVINNGLDNSQAPSNSDYDQMSIAELKAELMKKDIENARLKKGYVVKGSGGKKEYSTIPD